MNPKDLFHQLYEANIKEIEAIERLSLEYDMLDQEEYLNWKDILNKHSLDPDIE